VPSAVHMEAGGPRDHVIVPVDEINKITIGAIGMGRTISSLVTAVHTTDDRDEVEAFRERWNRLVPDVPLLIIESPFRAFAGPMLAYIERLEETEPEKRINVILPGLKARHWWERALHNRSIQRLRPFLLNRPRVRIVDFPYDVPR
jgi:hypothetical protein